MLDRTPHSIHRNILLEHNLSFLRKPSFSKNTTSHLRRPQQRLQESAFALLALSYWLLYYNSSHDWSKLHKRRIWRNEIWSRGILSKNRRSALPISEQYCLFQRDGARSYKDEALESRSEQQRSVHQTQIASFGTRDTQKIPYTPRSWSREPNGTSQSQFALGVPNGPCFLPRIHRGLIRLQIEDCGEKGGGLSLLFLEYHPLLETRYLS